MMSLRRSPALLAALLGLATGTAYGQRKPPQEFTRQGLLITNFAVTPGASLRTGRKAGDEVRSRIAKLVDKRATDVIGDDDIRDKMYRAGFDPDTTYSLEQIYSIGRSLRADEYVNGVISGTNNQVRLEATLVLMRDKTMRQPLPPATATTLEGAADIMAKNISAALLQLVQQRRCENAIRDGKGSEGVAFAREAVAQYPNATLARICMTWAMKATRAPANEILTVAQQVLAIDSMSFRAIEVAAEALDTLHRQLPAADMWLRLAATDTSDLELQHRAIFAITAGGSPKKAEPLVLRLSDAFRDNVPLAQQKWRVTFATRNWPRALEAGQFLATRDSAAMADSTFWLRLATVYRATNQPFRAIETLASSLTKFPKDARIYSLYTQYIKAEADSVLPRGLQWFPQSADLVALNAKELRTKGKLAESLDATKQAMSLDSSMTQGELVVAQLEMDLGRPDSALTALRRALLKGEDSSTVAQFALGRGNTLYRAASGTKTSTDFALSLRFLAFSDTVHKTVQSSFLTGAAAMGLAQAALTEAPKLTDKAEQCRLAKLAQGMTPMAKAGLEAGQSAYPEPAKQSLDYLGQLDPYVTQQITAFCAGTGS